jgi:hypothetical protein
MIALAYRCLEFLWDLLNLGLLESRMRFVTTCSYCQTQEDE